MVHGQAKVPPPPSEHGMCFDRPLIHVKRCAYEISGGMLLSNGLHPEEGQVQGAALDRDTALDAEAEALLAELARSQVEVHSLLQQQQDQVSELGGMKEHLSSEVSCLGHDDTVRGSSGAERKRCYHPQQGMSWTTHLSQPQSQVL